MALVYFLYGSIHCFLIDPSATESLERLAEREERGKDTSWQNIERVPAGDVRAYSRIGKHNL
jgi:hypothetical protein